jgi:hypothetical protein
MSFTFGVMWHTPLHKLFSHAPQSTYHPKSLLPEHHQRRDLIPASPALQTFVLTARNGGSQVPLVTQQHHLLQVHLLGSEERTQHRRTLPFTTMTCRASSHSQVVVCDLLLIIGDTGYHIA